MTGMIGFDKIACERGDGLLPQLRDLLEQRMQLAADPQLRELDEMRPGMRQSGPNPSATTGDAAMFRAGNVVAFPAPAAQVQSRPEKKMEG